MDYLLLNKSETQKMFNNVNLKYHKVVVFSLYVPGILGLKR